MKCIILLSLVALCYSYPYTSGYGSGYGIGYGYGSPYAFEKNYFMTPDGSIAIADATGKIITLQRGIGQNVGVIISDPYASGYSGYPFSYAYQPYQADSLAKILTQYQGEVNPYVYQQLLDEVRSAVQVGLVGDSIYQALVNFNQVGPNQWRYFGKTGLAGNPLYPIGGEAITYPGSGSSTWKSLINRIMYGGNYAPYSQYYLSGVVGQLAKTAQTESVISEGQSKLQPGQFLQEQRQKQLMNEQWLQKQRQLQQQDQQEIVKDEQQDVQQEQQEVVEQQKQQAYASPLKYFMSGGGPWTQTGYWQQQPSLYSLGWLYGAYGQGVNRYNVPLVV